MCLTVPRTLSAVKTENSYVAATEDEAPTGNESSGQNHRIVRTGLLVQPGDCLEE